MSLLRIATTLMAAASITSAMTSSVSAQQPAARTIVQRAVDLMGGDVLRNLQRVRFDMMTQWQRTGYRGVPHHDRPSFEPHVDIRDYTIPAWRNTRDFGARQLTNIVRDSVAITNPTGTYQPQSVAYVDERNELFMYSPDRLVLLLDAAPNLALGADTTIGGELHKRVTATVKGMHAPLPITVFFQAGSGLPTMLRFRQAHPNDFGLVPLGNMQVEVWYSNWRTIGGLSIPTQWDINRAGVPYKRMTVRSAAINPQFAADSFAIAGDLRDRFIAGRRAMHDVPVDSIVEVQPGLLRVFGFGYPTGLLRVGGEWLLLEGGYTPLNLERTREAAAKRGITKIAGAILGASFVSNGAVTALTADRTPVHTSAAAQKLLAVILANANQRATSLNVVKTGQSLKVGNGTLRIEPVDLPDAPGSIIAYSPELQWVYAPDALLPLDLRLVVDRAKALGWTVKAVGNARSLWSPVAGT